MGVITGVVGGMIRDLLLGEIPLVFRPEIHLYATAAIFGAGVCVSILRWEGELGYSLGAGLVSTLLLRLAGIRWRISLPVFEPAEPRRGVSSGD
jgi:uncharacterized membrane protein YeiH